MAEAKKGRGCWFYGCITTVIVGVVGLALLGLFMYFVVRKGVDIYTSKTPIAVAPVTLTDSQGGDALKRVEDFRKAMAAGQPVQPLELTGDELDYVVRNSKDGQHLRDAMHLVITNDQIHADLSMPLEVLSPMLAGRFLNGRADVGLHIRNGAVVVDLKRIEVNGQPAPQSFINSLQTQGIEWKPQANEPGAAIVGSLQDIEIKDGKILLKPKTSPQTPPR